MNALAIYDKLTAGRSRFIRVDRLCEQAGDTFPGLLPSKGELQAEGRLAQRDKKGLEKAQGLFLSQVLADPACGTHLCHAMLLPREESLSHLPDLEKTGKADFAGAQLRREGKASVLIMRNPRFPNAEDESTLDGMETGSTWRCLTRRPRSACCAAEPSSIRNSPAGACSAPASTSRTSIRARSASSGT